MSEKPQPLSIRPVVATFVAVALSFVAAAAWSAFRASAIDRAATEIASGTAPTILHLANARLALRQIDGLLGGPLDDVTRAQVVHAWRECQRELDAIPAEPESATRTELRSAATEIDQRIRVWAEGPDAHGNDLRWLVRRLSRLALDDTQANGQRTELLALHIESQRHAVVWLSALLTALALALSIAAAVFLLRSLRRYSDLVEAHARMERQRIDELDQFAARVAHDILNPLSTVGLALQAAERGADAQRWTTRAKAGLDRACRIADGLLAFARSGAHPEPGTRADVGEAVAGVVDEFRAAAERARVELRVDGFAPTAVACLPGILTSLVENLVSNAIKYIGEAEERRVSIAVREAGARVRIEVADSGPGLPPGMEEAVFDPYVRAARRDLPGFGIGLATVKRVAEAHGGAVGVVSSARGAVFWFELPRA